MSLNMTLTVTNAIAAEEIPDEVAETMTEAYEALAKLPANRMLNIDFTADGYTGPAKVGGELPTEEYKAAWNARRFVKLSKAWAEAQEVTLDVIDKDGTKIGERTTALTFVRKGDVTANPARVSFRVYAPRPPKSETAEDVK
jgi:hypothetical protein